MRIRLLVCLVSAVLLSKAALAQSVRWEPSGGSLPVGQATALQLIFEDCDPKEPPKPPKVDGLDMQYADQSSSMSWENGNYSHSVIFTYSAMLSKSESVDIPSFEVETSKGRISVPAVHFDPTGATVGNSGEALDSAASSSITATPESVWAGEVFDLNYKIEAAHNYYPDFGHATFDWKPDPLIAEDWSQPVPFDIRSAAEPQTGLAYRTRAIIQKPGTVTVNPASQLVNLSIGMTGLGFFQQRQYQQFSVTSSAPTIEVKPLPPAPSGFTGAVGHFTLTSKVVPASSPVGEPITWTLELTGEGNWPDIPGLPARDVSRDFQVVQPKAKRSPTAGKLFDAALSEDVVLVPTKPGIYDLEPVTFTYFDPKDGTYKTTTAPGATVTISAPPPAEGQAPAAGSPRFAGGNPSANAGIVPSPPNLPSGLPRDALPDSGAALSPWSAQALAFLLLVPFALMLFFWLWLALRRAKETDPRRARREAHDRLSATLAAMDGSTQPDPVLISAWQRDAAILLEIAHAAPCPSQLQPPDSTPGALTAGWATLWAEADRSLYGPQPGLPEDWHTRAKETLAAQPAPPFSLGQMFLPRNLLPWMFALILAAAMFGAPGSARGDGASSGAAAYRRGDFRGAETAWREVVASDPADWSARHNLSLALAQQNRWDEAAAQAAAAFVQQPNNEAVRWQFALACEKAGFAPETLAAFLTPGPLQSVARLESPAAWQLVLVVAAWLFAASLGVLIALGYRGKKPRKAVVATALAVPGLAVVLAGTALLGWFAYGPAANDRAVVTWRDASLCSIPTEADTSQKTVPLAPGSVGLDDKDFLGWTRLAFENGQTGWVRKEEAVGLWR